MAIIERHWEKLTDDQWQHLAKQYLLEIRENKDRDYAAENNKWGQVVTNLGFWSPPELLWKFILVVVSLAETDEELANISAGSVEYLRSGKEFIALVEQEAKTNPKFAKMLTGCQQYTMTDAVWQRLQIIQARTNEKLITQDWSPTATNIKA